MIPANVLKNSVHYVSIQPSAYRLLFICQMFTHLLYGQNIRQILESFLLAKFYSTKYDMVGPTRG
jgi:hypothetical protein